MLCVFCSIYLYRWFPNDDPLTEHKKFNKNCKFILLLQDFNYQSTIQYHAPAVVLAGTMKSSIFLLKCQSDTDV